MSKYVVNKCNFMSKNKSQVTELVARTKKSTCCSLCGAHTLIAALLITYVLSDRTLADPHAKPNVAKPVTKKLLTVSESQLRAEASKLISAAGFNPDNYTRCLGPLSKLLEIQNELYPKHEFPEGHPHVAHTLLDIARCKHWIRDYQDAVKYGTEAIRMCERLEATSLSLIRAYEQVASIYMDSGDRDRYVSSLVRAFELSKYVLSIDYFPHGHPESARIAFELASLYRFQGELEQANSEYDRAVQICRNFTTKYPTLPDVLVEETYYLYSLALRGRLDMFLYSADFRQAEQLLLEREKVLRRVYEATNSSPAALDVARNLVDLGALRVRLGRPFDGITGLEGALHMLKMLPPNREAKQAIVECLAALAFAHQFAGKFEIAKGHCEVAIQYLEEDSNVPIFYNKDQQLAQLRSRYGLILTSLGEIERGRQIIESALDLRKSLANKNGSFANSKSLAVSFNDMAAAWTAQGELGRAVECAAQVVKLIEELYPAARFPQGHADLAIAYQNLGNRYADLEDLTEARKCLTKAVQIWENIAINDSANLDKPSWANALAGLAMNCCDNGELSRAKQYMERATKIIIESYNINGTVRDHPYVVQTLRYQASVEIALENPNAASDYSKRAYEMASRLYPKSTLPMGHKELALTILESARSLLATQNYVESYAAAVAGMKMQQHLADQILPYLSESEICNYIAANVVVSDALIPAWRKAALSVEDLYGVLWERRAIVMRTLCQRQMSAHRNASKDLENVFDELRYVGRQLAHCAGVLSGGQVEQVVTAEHVSELMRRRESLERQVALVASGGGNAYLKPSSAGPTALSELLASGECYIEFIAFPVRAKGARYSVRYGAFIVPHRSAIRFLDLGDGPVINESVLRFRSALINRDDYEEEGRNLRNVLWQQLEAALPASVARIYVCPLGLLGAIPWPALPGKEAGTFLLDSHAFSLVPSGHHLCEWLRSRGKRRNEDGTILIVGDVDYTTKDLKVDQVVKHRGVAGSDGTPFLPLPGTRDEIAAIKTLYRPDEVKVLTGVHASVRNVLLELKTAKCAHFATHGFFANSKVRSVLDIESLAQPQRSYITDFQGNIAKRNPSLLSGLVLAGANRPDTTGNGGNTDHGILSADSIELLPLEKLNLVILSGCDTGLGNVAGNEGVMGLQRAFHLAGASNVIASLWNVDDHATSKLMRTFYYELAETKNAMEALHLAQLQFSHKPESTNRKQPRGRIDFSESMIVRKTTSKPLPTGKDRAHPRYWAAFILSGIGN